MRQIAYGRQDTQVRVPKGRNSDKLPCFGWVVSSYVASQHIAVVTQTNAKDKFYSTVYFIILNPICVDQRLFKNEKKNLSYGDKPKLKEG